MRCEHCSDFIDTDEDVECFTRDEHGKYGEGPCLCESCRDDYYCTSCGEMPRFDQTDFCFECHPAPLKYDARRADEYNAEMAIDCRE